MNKLKENLQSIFDRAREHSAFNEEAFELRRVTDLQEEICGNDLGELQGDACDWTLTAIEAQECLDILMAEAERSRV
jgi:hypothetical protein